MQPNDVFQNVLEFTVRFCPKQFRATPGWPEQEILNLRLDLMVEEFTEMLTAIDNRNLEEFADALGDLEYVLNGFAIACGIDLRRVNAAIQAANMAKVGGPMREDGKVLKPEGWKSPDIELLLLTQQPLGNNDADADGN